MSSGQGDEAAQQQQKKQQEKREEEEGQQPLEEGAEEPYPEDEADLAYDEEGEEGEEAAQAEGATKQEGSGDTEEGGGDDDEFEQLRQQVNQNESSLQQDREALNQVMKTGSQESREEADRRSVFVQNVDYGTSEVDLQLFFKDCGPVRRITIGRGPTGQPKGFAYVEFTDEAAVETAKGLTNQMLKGRQVTVLNKRTNVPGLRKRGRGRGRGRGRYFRGYRGGRGRGRSRGARGYAVYFSTS
ncbi:hypothetical protein PTSG_05149 [Salpingoeca rosetta]|uniref:RRM domain-containing protein n=1 Tax=Salpingoeca rosetta (strain ATCC 50818 / BSB-021) TaxID=946362 RepID=F2UAM9_SALR5|nr:uncharacterized protein PTSG_05149 [Salpingoeca rosetta]EGD73445.1 hypothetical protein PTSG_05149 [Salpingoeca rosetta]|eukprot:XP_004993727.1 hypothetical protein PTSG_05149 [Salpingoeca rosetta]